MHSVLLCQRPGLDSIRVFSALKFKERSLFTGRLNLFVCFNYCPVNIQIFQDSFDFNVLRNSATKHEKKIMHQNLAQSSENLMNRVRIWIDRQIKYWDYRNHRNAILVDNEVKYIKLQWLLFSLSTWAFIIWVGIGYEYIAKYNWFSVLRFCGTFLYYR